MQAVESYSSYKIDGEHRMNTLAHELIEEQVELLRNHRQSSDANIHALQDRVSILKMFGLIDIHLQKIMCSQRLAKVSDITYR